MSGNLTVHKAQKAHSSVLHRQSMPVPDQVGCLAPEVLHGAVASVVMFVGRHKETVVVGTTGFLASA